MKSRRNLSPPRNEETRPAEDLEDAGALFELEKKPAKAQRTHGSQMQRVGAFEQEEYLALPVEPPKPTTRRTLNEVAPRRQIEDERAGSS
jgi:hypothetical protein